MKQIIIGLVALAALTGGIFLLSGKTPLRQSSDGASKETSKKLETKIEDKIYVAIEEVGEIAVISVKDRNVIKRIDLSSDIGGTKIGFMPHNVQVAPDNKSVWVTANAMDMSGNKVSFNVIPKARADEGHGEEADIKANDEIIVIDPLTDKIIKRIEMGTDLHLSHIALTPDSNYAIAAAQSKGVIYKINAKTYEVEKEINTEKGAEPHGLRISPDGQTAYIAMLKGKSIGVLDIQKITLSYVPLKGAAVQTGVTANGRYALASVYDAKSLAVYDIASQKLSYIDLPEEAKGPVQIYPTPDSRFVYVADQGYYFNQPNSDLVYKIDLQEMKVAETIKGGTAPHGVAVSKDGKFAYVTNLLSEDLSVIDTALGKETARIKVGKMPNGVSLFYGGGLVSPITEGEIVSRNGLHWHATLAIYEKGIQQDIPADIGIGVAHMPIHTHDQSGTVHMEFAGLVRKEDLTLEQFFKNWGKDLKGLGGKMTMTVNGNDNAELGSYIMKDNDKIEIRYE